MRKNLFIVNFYLILILLLLLILTLVYAQDPNNLNESGNQTDLEVSEIEITKFFPKEVKLGEVQFNIQIKNNKNEIFENVFAIVRGAGFSTYDVTPIEKLGPYEKDYIFVNGKLENSGEINLSITIGKNIFYQKITVIDVGEKQQQNEKEKESQRFVDILQELEILKENYTELEVEISEKKEDNYDLSGVNLEDLKEYLRDIESNAFRKDLQGAEISLSLAKEEYFYQKNKVDNSRVIPLIQRLKENAVVISAILGAILAFIAVSEILKKKGQSTYHTIRRVGTKITKSRRNKKV